MPQLFDITTSILYQEGMEKGMEKGVEKGLERGIMKKTLILIVNMLNVSDMPLAQIAQITGVDEKVLLVVNEKIDTGVWEHPIQWTDEQWNVYFSNPIF